jgi:hypothetical protein
MKIFKINSKTKKKDLLVYEDRIKNKNLIWVKQIIKILKFYFPKEKKKINDLGCNLFQLYKGLKNQRLNKKFLYFGYDHDKTYINYGLKYFPELKKKYKVLDLEKKRPMKADISVISATLEHLNKPSAALDNFLRSTNQLVIIRSFFGKKKIKKLFNNKKYVDNPYYINQYSFSWVKNLLLKQNFKIIEIQKDKATEGRIKRIYPEIYRKFYIIIAKKNVI